MVLTTILTVRVQVLSSGSYLYLMLLDRKRRELTYVIGLECVSILAFLALSRETTIAATVQGEAVSRDYCLKCTEFSHRQPRYRCQQNLGASKGVMPKRRC
jgi:hypothetical protein